jgi:flagellar protein FlbD
MIRLTHRDGRSFVVNAELVKFVEETPDTVVTLRDNEKLLVKESAGEVVERVVEYARLIRSIVPGG